MKSAHNSFYVLKHIKGNLAFRRHPEGCFCKRCCIQYCRNCQGKWA